MRGKILQHFGCLSCLRPAYYARRHTVLRVRLCIRPKTLLARYLAECLTHFHQTYVNDHYETEMNASQFGVKRLSHDGIKYAGNSTSGLVNMMS